MKLSSGGVYRLSITIVTIVLLSIMIASANEPKEISYNDIPTTYDIYYEDEMFHQAITPMVETEMTLMTMVDQPIASEPNYVLYDIPLDDDLQIFIINRCEELDISVPLVLAMIWTESTYRADIISNTGDWGLMQINKINHQWLSEELGLTNFLDPYQSVTAGIHIISNHLKATGGNIHQALMMYNFGPTGAKRLWDQGIVSSKYSRLIVDRMDLLYLR